MKENGIISNELEKAIADKVDRMKKFKNPLVEMADGPVVRMAIHILDASLGEKVAEDHRDEVIATLEGFAYDQPEKMTSSAIELIQEVLGDKLSGFIAKIFG
jgi:hypothetical protein